MKKPVSSFFLHFIKVFCSTAGLRLKMWDAESERE